mgnify:CR=1 FL=1
MQMCSESTFIQVLKRIDRSTDMYFNAHEELRHLVRIPDHSVILSGSSYGFDIQFGIRLLQPIRYLVWKLGLANQINSGLTYWLIQPVRPMFNLVGQQYVTN